MWDEFKDAKKEISACGKLPIYSYKMFPCILTSLADDKLLNERNIEKILKMSSETYQKLNSFTKEPNGLYSIYNDKKSLKEVQMNLLNQSEELVFDLSQRVDVCKKICTVALSSIDNKIAAAGSDNNIYVWDLYTKKSIAKFRSKSKIEISLNSSSREKHLGKINSLMFSDCGTFLVSGGEEKNVRVWDLTKKTNTRILEGHSKTIQAVAIANDHTFIASGGDDNTVIFWKNYQEAQRYEHNYGVLCVAFSPNKHVIVSGSIDSSIIVWSIELGVKYHTLNTSQSSTNLNCIVNSVHVSPCGQFICSAGSDKLVRVWNLETGESLFAHRAHTEAVTAVRFLPCGKRIVSGGLDKSVIVWRMDTKEKEACLRDDNNKILCVDVSNPGSLIVTGGEDDKVRYWTNVKP